ncbi:aldehyde dehydrogenase family protein [Streptomyces sp. NPDC057257]|uniref:aldehyde dehydrogenase family protein n=1 Tax=Streptomyces sp. NPDC057257 TaxID=3346071 RepID=UPI0036429015
MPATESSAAAVPGAGALPPGAAQVTGHCAQVTGHCAQVTGHWSSDTAADDFTVENPANGSLLAVVRGAGPKQVDEAVRAAHAAQPAWRAVTPRRRGEYLRQIAAALREDLDGIAAVESRENGKPLSQARFDVLSAATVFDLFGSLGEAIPGSVRDAGGILDITTLEPYGVIGAILPFNWPPIVTAGKTAAALVVGNTVVVKPPEQAPLSVLRMFELIEPILPPDVVRVVPGTGTAGAALAGHPLIGKISFTGAPTTGAKVIKAAADNLTPTLMELGGKNPFIVFDDADITSAVRWALEGGYYNQGEACTAASRVLVQAGVHDEFAERLGEAVRRLRVGDGADPATDVGPLVTEAHRERVVGYIGIGEREGAVIAAQAALPSAPELAGGYFAPPTLFTGVTRDMRIANEEIFGPVVSLIRFDDEDEAVSIANGTDFGLVGAVFTANAERLVRVAKAISASVMFLNHYSRAGLFGTPFGGTKHSGYGRLHAQQTLTEFAHTKTLRLPTGTEPITTLDFFASHAFD